MAIILEGSDQCPVIWGKLGQYQIQRTKQGKMYLRTLSHGLNPNTIAQQNLREAFREAVSRWKNFEKNLSPDYWEDLAKLKEFTSGYHVFISSFILIYKEKITELGNHAAAIIYVQNIANPISYRDSTFRQQKIESDKLLNQAILDYQKTSGYKTLVKESLDHLKSKGWLTKTKYGILPYINSAEEPKLKKLNVVPVEGGFGSFTYGTGSYGKSPLSG